MERKFLIYLLYITLVELREHAYTSQDKKTYWMCDLLHNVPPCLENENDNDVKDIFKQLQENAAAIGMEKWFETRMNEFLTRNSNYEKDGSVSN